MNEYLEATGYDWVEYELDEKREVIQAIYEMLKFPETTPVEIALKALDDFYTQLQEDLKQDPKIPFEQIMNTPCLKAVATIMKSSIKKDGNDNK